MTNVSVMQRRVTGLARNLSHAPIVKHEQPTTANVIVRRERDVDSGLIAVKMEGQE